MFRSRKRTDFLRCVRGVKSIAHCIISDKSRPCAYMGDCSDISDHDGAKLWGTVCRHTNFDDEEFITAASGELFFYVVRRP